MCLKLSKKVGRAKFISVFDATKGYHQCLVSPKDRWKTGFICDNSVYEWVRCPFGLRSSGFTFLRAMQIVLQPVAKFTPFYVDDMAVYTTDSWKEHIKQLEQYFVVIRQSGLTLNLSKATSPRGCRVRGS